MTIYNQKPFKLLLNVCLTQNTYRANFDPHIPSKYPQPFTEGPSYCDHYGVNAHRVAKAELIQAFLSRNM